MIQKIAILAVILAILGCEQYPKRLGPEEIISVDPHHATRIFIKYRDKNGQIYIDTIHQSNKFSCGDVTIDPHDYLGLYGGSMPYGAFNADEYKAYKKCK
jgi:hypothetical protein